jgi:outer membrane protein OmpA-like peptidoglycan-associated protein
MSQNEDLIIYAKSHTDSRGNDYMDLSERRANSTIHYIISKGISADRISGKGFGESELKVNCGLKCTEDEHALNRRSEFMIVRSRFNNNNLKKVQTVYSLFFFQFL